MRCLSISKSGRQANDSRRRFSWGFLSQNSTSSKKSDKCAVSPSLSHPQMKRRDVHLPTSEPLASTEPIGTSDSDVNIPPITRSVSQKPPELRIFSFAELKAATRNFSRSNLLGEGGFGCVYKANIKSKDGGASQEVAVKQLNRKGQQGHKEWLSEVHFLGMVEHPNLVKLVGYCAEDDERGIQRLLVYEFMPNRSLADHLFRKSQAVLSWQDRLCIILGAARGLAYLHEEISDTQVIFRDFKTSNVLLDKDFTPKLSDFGLARQGPEIGASHVTTVVVGTMGYAAPEYVQTGHLTAKSDVWSFGVVLLEILSGRKSMDQNRPKNEQHLLDWMRPFFQGHKKVHNFMDPRLEGRYSLTQAERIAALALVCLHKSARTRPLMSAVVAKLIEIAEQAESGNVEVNALPTSPCSGTRVEANREGTKEPAQLKRRRLLMQSVRKFTWRGDAGHLLRARTPKAVCA